MLTSFVTILALVLGSVLLAAALYFATRPAAPASRFGWAVVAGLALSVLGMATALRANTNGFPAAMMQLLATVLAGALGALSAAPSGESRDSKVESNGRRSEIGRRHSAVENAPSAESQEPGAVRASPAHLVEGRSLSTPESRVSSSLLGRLARGFAWFTLVGLPPTYGFHARVGVLNAYLAANWGWLLALGLLATGILLIPALWEMRAPRAGSPRGLHAVLVLLLIAAILFFGLYPYPATFGLAPALPPG